MKVAVDYDTEMDLFTVEIGYLGAKGGAVLLQLPGDQVRKMASWTTGGPTTIVLKKDLIENRMVESMELDGKIYTKTDLRDYVAAFGDKRSED